MLTAPKVDEACEKLNNLSKHSWAGYSYDLSPSDAKLMTEIFDLVHLFKSTPGEPFQIWLHTPKGTIEEYKELIFSDDDESLVEDVWRRAYPKDEHFYFVSFLNEENGYKAISVDHRVIVEVSPSSRLISKEEAMGSFLEWVRDALLEAIEEVKSGTYKQLVEENAPYTKRQGEVLLGDWWKVCPEARQEFFEKLTEKDIEDFCALADNNKCDIGKHNPEIKEMNAGDYFNLAYMVYKAIGYDVDRLSPKDAYDKYAYGHDAGLTLLPLGSNDEFAKWVRHRDYFGGHPWAILGKTPASHLSLRLALARKGGYQPYFSFPTYARTPDAVLGFLAIHASNTPIYFPGASRIVDRLCGKEVIGIVPQNIEPRYCSNLFENKEIKFFVNISSDIAKEIAPCVQWKEIDEVELI